MGILETLVLVAIGFGAIGEVAPEGSMVDKVAESVTEIAVPAAVGAGVGHVVGTLWLGGASTMSVAGTAWSSAAVVGTGATVGGVAGAAAK